MNEEFTIKALDQAFRIRKLNAIEIFALRSQIDFDNYKTTKDSVELMLENLEVKLGDNWLKVKDGDIYYPNGIEENYDAIDELVRVFLKKFRSVFQKSNVSSD